MARGRDLIAQTESSLVTELPPTQDINVAFSVALSTDQGPTSTERAPFDLVFINYGDAYDVSTHEFIAPVAGVYHFTVAVLTTATRYAQLQLNHNGVRKMDIYDQDSTASSTTGAANSIILQLLSGDRVHVDMYGQSVDTAYYYYGDPSFSQTSFTGMLLFRI